MAGTAGFISEPARQTPIKAETEVLVIGGGSAGVSAAVAAARNGAEVILVERLGISRRAGHWRSHRAVAHAR